VIKQQQTSVAKIYNDSCFAEQAVIKMAGISRKAERGFETETIR